MANNFVPFPTPDETPELYLVGIRLDPTAEGPQLYTLVAAGGQAAQPPMVDGRILFFSRPSLAGAAAKLAGNAEAFAKASGANPQTRFPEQLDILCDVAQALFLVNSQAEDSDGLLLDCVACLDDLVRATRLSVPANYMAVLGALAERLEENPEFGSFLQAQGIDRETVEDALMWCMGAVAVKAKWIG